jgi:hypothetical protein
MMMMKIMVMMMSVKQLMEWELVGKLKYSQKTYSSSSLSATNLTLPDQGSNPAIVVRNQRLRPTLWHGVYPVTVLEPTLKGKVMDYWWESQRERDH